MDTEFEYLLSEGGDIVFRIDKYNRKLYEIAKLKTKNESYAYNAIRFRKEKLKDLYDLLNIGLHTPKSDEPILTTNINGTSVEILNYFGEFEAEYHKYQFMYTLWNCDEKYDFHPWYSNYTECDKGIRLTHAECFKLAWILKKKFGFEEKI